jgi:hypothetical protein
MGYDYMGMSFQFVIFGFSLLFVFLIPAALCESWPLPFGVLLSTPVAVFGAFAVLWPRRVVAGWFLPAYMVQIECQRHRHFPGGVAPLLDRRAVTRVETAGADSLANAGMRVAGQSVSRPALEAGRCVSISSLDFAIGVETAVSCSGMKNLGLEAAPST